MSKRTRTDTGSAADFLPERITIPAMRDAVQHCQGCDLYKNATQAVFGEGPPKAQLMFVGEIPGDQEDLAGRPFVGPAGQLLNTVLEAVGIDRNIVYVTNAVKHFRWKQVGKRRRVDKPTLSQVRACRPWLENEIRVIRPRLLVCLGATAAQSLFGADFRVTKERGRIFESQWAPLTMATIHPSAVLRAPDDRMRRQMRDAFTADLAAAAKAIRKAARDA